MRRRKRRPLDREQLVRAALALLDEVGFDELTMRRLAERLGVKAASLYRHVRDKEELLVLLADEISAGIPAGTGAGSWQAQLGELGRNYRRGLLAHRDAARVLASTAPLGPNRLRLIETAMRILRSAGLSKRDTARAGYHLNNYVTEFVADEARFAAAAQALGMNRGKLFVEVRDHFRSLPPAEYPVLIELADQLAENDPDGLFEFGMRVFLQGIEQLVERGAEIKRRRRPA